MGYLRRTSNYLERITLSDLTHVMSMTDHVAIGVETPRLDSGCSLDKEFTKLICMVLCQAGNQVDSCHNYIRSPLT